VLGPVVVGMLYVVAEDTGDSGTWGGLRLREYRSAIGSADPPLLGVGTK